ncbi:MAG: 30S ribosomal protein S1 [Clostridia bacterium]|nr:30S ribosomal protein S1 [Clostridia bacterium]
MNRYAPEGTLITTPENTQAVSSPEGLAEALEKQTILEAVALMCDGDFSLHFTLGGMPALMLREEVQYSRRGEPTKDIAVLTRVGRPCVFKVVGFTRREDGVTVALLSRRAAQAECMASYIDTLEPGDVIPARVTHMEPFGAFVDIGCGIVSLLSIDCISVSRISHPSDRFAVGDRLYTVVRRRDEEGRIYVTHRELLGTWEENAALFSPGETVIGTVRSVESYGIFVELLPNLAGLAELREGVRAGDTAAVYIKSILPEKMKLKLIVISANAEEPRRAHRYFLTPETTPHIDRWVYSPEGAAKRIETVF